MTGKFNKTVFTTRTYKCHLNGLSSSIQNETRTSRFVISLRIFVYKTLGNSIQASTNLLQLQHTGWDKSTEKKVSIGRMYEIPFGNYSLDKANAIFIIRLQNPYKTNTYWQNTNDIFGTTKTIVFNLQRTLRWNIHLMDGIHSIRLSIHRLLQCCDNLRETRALSTNILN